MDQVTSKQLSEWEAYDKLDPIGTWREDFRLAYMASLITNLTISVHGKKGTKMTDPMDFMLDWMGNMKKKGQSVEEMKQALMAFAQGQNKRVEREKKMVNRKPPVKKGNKK